MKRSVFLILLILTLGYSKNIYGQPWKQWLDSANVYIKNTDFDNAATCYLQAKKMLKQDSVYSLTYLSICDQLADLYSSMDQYEKAEAVYLEEKSIKEKKEGRETATYSKTCTMLADVYRDMGRYDTSLLIYTEAKNILYRAAGKYNTDYAIICGNMGAVYFYKGEYLNAQPLFEEAKEIQNVVTGPLDREYAAYINNLAQLYENMGQYERAEPLYIEARETTGKLLGKEHQQYGLYCNNLANLYRATGNYSKAELLLLETIKVLEQALGPENSLCLKVINNLAILYNTIGQYEKAESLLLNVKETAKQKLGEASLVYSNVCNSLAMVYIHNGENEKAKSLITEAMVSKEKSVGKDHPDYGQLCNNLASVYQMEGNYRKAESLSLQAMQIQENKLGKTTTRYAEYCNRLAMIYQNTGDYKKAETLLLDSKNTREKLLGKQHMDYGASCVNLAKLYWTTHNIENAQKFFDESFHVNKTNVNAVFQFTNEKEKTSFIKNRVGEDNLVYSFYLKEKLASAQPYEVSLFHRNLILSASQDLRKQILNTDDTAVIATYNEWINLKKYLAVLYSRPINKRNENISEVEQKAELLEKNITRLSINFKNHVQITNWTDIKEKLNPGEVAIEFIAFNYFNGSHYTDSIYYIALLLRKDNPLPILVKLFEKKQLEGLFSDRKEPGAEITNMYASRGIIVKGEKVANNKSVYDLIWKPLEKQLAGIHTIYFAPAGLLHRVSFAALPINKNEVLSDRYKLVQLATTASVTDQAPSYIISTDNIQLYGGINYNTDTTSLKQSAILYASNVQNENSRSVPTDLTRSGSFNYLAGTANEIKAIENESHHVNGHVSSFSADAATEESFKAMNGNASPSIIHIATHGFFFPDPINKLQEKNNEVSGQVFRESDNPFFRSGLLFAGANNAWQGKPIEGIEDGILTAYEVSNMYLPNTKLAVLSACETALGDIQGSEGVYGLQRAFKMAGVQNLVMSLWKVPDAETAEFMQLFYKNMFNKQSISDAFYHAQIAMKNKYRKDPYKWAAWVLVR